MYQVMRRNVGHRKEKRKTPSKASSVSSASKTGGQTRVVKRSTVSSAQSGAKSYSKSVPNKSNSQSSSSKCGNPSVYAKSSNQTSSKVVEPKSKAKQWIKSTELTSRAQTSIGHKSAVSTNKNNTVNPITTKAVTKKNPVSKVPPSSLLPDPKRTNSKLKWSKNSVRTKQLNEMTNRSKLSKRTTKSCSKKHAKSKSLGKSSVQSYPNTSFVNNNGPGKLTKIGGSVRESANDGSSPDSTAVHTTPKSNKARSLKYSVMEKSKGMASKKSTNSTSNKASSKVTDKLGKSDFEMMPASKVPVSSEMGNASSMDTSMCSTANTDSCVSSVDANTDNGNDSIQKREVSSWLFRWLGEYEQVNVKGQFEMFLHGESFVIQHNQSLMDKIVDVYASESDTFDSNTPSASQSAKPSIQYPTKAPQLLSINGSRSSGGKTAPPSTTKQTEPQSARVSARPKSKSKSEMQKMIATGGVNRFDLDMGKAVVGGVSMNSSHINTSMNKNTNVSSNTNSTSANTSAQDPSPSTNRRRPNTVNRRPSQPQDDPALLAPGPGLLERAQQARQTRNLPGQGGKNVQQNVLQKLTTEAEQDAIRANPKTMAKLLAIITPPFNQMSIITPNLGLTGGGGLVKERFEQFGPSVVVGCVMNVTYELPLLKMVGIETFRVPVEDDAREDLFSYFEDVTSKIEAVKQRNQATVVHCMAGVSRSATIVIAYLIAFENMSLETAFRHTKQARPVINPNLGFLQQLAQFESLKRPVESCSPWIEHTEEGITKRLPEFIIKDFLEEYQVVFDDIPTPQQ